ncbi:MAG: peptide ABC transporter substrate-binding protein [Vallitalea sp.]|nr:peptide ABC transporter substrate-binding protein [Vallitalea sp.]
MKRLMYIFLIICSISLIGGCGKTNDNNKDNEVKEDINEEENKDVEEEKEPVKAFGGELKLLMRNPSTLNPLVNNDRTVDQALKLVFDSLFILDEKEKPMPNLVDSYELSSTGTSITIKLKKNILFHDKEELHSDDVVYSIETLKNAPDDAVYKSNVANYKRISIIDEYSFKIYFDQPFAFSLYTMTFPIIPKHHYSDSLDMNMNPIGTGAYSFTDFTAMKELNLTANNDWFKHKLYVENIKIIITRDKDYDKDAFDQKIVDLITPIKFDWQKYADKEGVNLTEYTTYYYTFLGFNFNNKVLNDKNIRKSIAYAINRQAIIKNEFLNHAKINEYPYHPLSWLNETNNLIYNIDIDKSKELVNASGYSDSDEDNILDKNIDNIKRNLELRLLVNNENPVRVSIANKIKESLENIGFVINLDLVDNVTYNNKIMNKDFDILLAEWKLSQIPDLTFAFHSSAIEEGKNFINYSNVDMDRVLESIFNSVNENDLMDGIKEFKSLFVDDVPYLSLFFRTSAVISNDRVYGELTPSIYNNYNGIQNLFIFE